MTLQDGQIQFDINEISIADMDDFRALTGQDLSEYSQDMRKNRAKWSGMSGFSWLSDPELRAFLWIMARDEQTRAQTWSSVEELRARMETDIRGMKLTDFERIAVSNPPASNGRSNRASEPAIDDATRALLAKHGYRTPAQIAGASDKDLLAIKGIGRQRLHQIRAAQQAGALS